jgi:hypothetical protein
VPDNGPSTIGVEGGVSEGGAVGIAVEDSTADEGGVGVAGVAVGGASVGIASVSVAVALGVGGFTPELGVDVERGSVESKAG